MHCHLCLVGYNVHETACLSSIGSQDYDEWI